MTATEANNVEMERATLGALLVSEPAVSRVIDGSPLRASDFYLDRHRMIYEAIVDLHAADKPCDELTVGNALAATGKTEQSGGPNCLSELAATCPAPGNARHYADIVFDLALKRAARVTALELEAGRITTAEAIDELTATEKRRPGAPRNRTDRLERAGGYLLDVPEHQGAIWGAGDQVLWPRGESLLVAAPQGVGKTTVVQQLALSRCGVRDPSLLGLTVTPDERPCLYISADRPAQARRSGARMIEEEDRDKLDAGLLIWRGPPPVNVITDPSSLARWGTELGVGTIIMDSLKDLAVGLAEDAVGASVNQAVQEVVAAGIEFAACHHQRKSQDGRKPRGLDDVYGSTWLTAGAGSVILLWGKPGDSYVELTHLKQPAGEVGPMEIHHDHVRGVTTVPAPVDLIDLAHHGIEVKEAASKLYSTDTPDHNQVERARRKLDRMAADGLLERHHPGGKKPVVYAARSKGSVIARDSRRDRSRELSRPLTQTPDMAPRAITAPITAYHGPSGRPADPLKGAADPPRDQERDNSAAPEAPEAEAAREMDVAVALIKEVFDTAEEIAP